VSFLTDRTYKAPRELADLPEPVKSDLLDFLRISTGIARQVNAASALAVSIELAGLMIREPRH
jgi:hypothetical protein